MRIKLTTLAIAVLAAYAAVPATAQTGMGAAHGGHGKQVAGGMADMPGMAMEMGGNGGAEAMKGAQPDAPSAEPTPSPQQPRDMGGMGGMAGMDHAAMPGMASPAPSNMAPRSEQPQGMAGMNHGAAPDAASPASSDIRDPNAYSDGYALDSGKYALPGTRQLRLADEHNFGNLLFDRLERAYGRDANATAYDMQAWFGRDYDRLIIKAEGEVAQGKLQDARTELLWGHAIANYWDAQLGVRIDNGGSDREWLALGVQGLAPYWFDVDATAYLGSNGRTALRLASSYELLLTQRLILQPRAEVNVYGKRDAARGIGSGVSDALAGLRLRYEINRQLAPYVGIEWTDKFGQTADMARAAGERTSDTRLVAGVRFWF